jgi:hypothetical protein
LKSTSTHHERECRQAHRPVPVESVVSRNRGNSVTLEMSNDGDLFHEATGGVACQWEIYIALLTSGSLESWDLLCFSLIV